MALGAFVRGLFGRHEHRVAEAYRSVFVDLDALVGAVAAHRPRARRILEIGCGEGAMTEKLALAYPAAEILAVDPSPRLGRLYRGDRAMVAFRQGGVEGVAAGAAGGFDLVLLCDVLHHVPAAARPGLLRTAASLLAPGGTFVFKDWAPSRTVMHCLCEGGDRLLTGDRVSYLSEAAARALVEDAFRPAPITLRTAHVPPNRNNFAFFIEAGAPVGSDG